MVSKRQLSNQSLASLCAAGVLAAGLFFSAPSPVRAQAQPPVADNNQDETVHIPGPAADADGVLTIFRSGDKTQVNRYVSEVVPLKHAEAQEILPHVLKAVRLEGGTARSLKYTDPTTGKLSFFMQVVTTERQMPTILKSIEAIDLPGVVSSEGELMYTVRARYRRASEIAAVIARTCLSGEGKVAADDVSNSLWIFDSQSDGLRDVEYVKFYDVPPPQVEFDVQVVEINERDGGKVGLDWDAWKRSLGGQADWTANVFEGGEAFSRLDALLTLDARVLAEFLNYTLQTGTARSVHHSRVTASNESPALISSFKRVSSPGFTRIDRSPAVLTETTPGVSARDEDGNQGAGPRTVLINPPATFTRAELGKDHEGIEIAIHPTIATEMVTARAEILVQSVDGLNALDEPIVATREIVTLATLKDQQPFLLGSLERQIAHEERRGIPGLKDAPVIKYVFGVTSKRVERSRVFIVAKPTYKNQLEYVAQSMTSAKFDAQPPTQETPVALPPDVAMEVTKQENEK